VGFAAINDYDDLLRFLFEVKDEVDEGRAEEDLIAALVKDFTHRVGGIALIIRGDSGIEASLGIKIERPMLSRSHYLRSVWNVVLPEARLTGHARSLLIAARQFADEIGRPILLEEWTPQIDAPKARLVSRHFKTAGAIFRHLPAVS
jgi:GNAT superfamily N-acetyltransferase